MKDRASQLEFEEALEVGDTVLVRWTNSHNYYQGEGEVLKVNVMTVRIKLTRPPHGYPVGQEFPVPLSGHRKWSMNNRVFAVVNAEDNAEAVLEQSTAPIG